jgi:6-phosphogluconolactonase
MILDMQRPPEIIVAENPAKLADTAARAIVDAALEAVKARGRFTISLAGGSTPRATYERLAQSPLREQMPWAHTWIFFGDERGVGPEHPESNFRMANAALISKVPVPAAQVFRIRGEDGDPEAAATNYARTVSEVFGGRRGELPRFDLILLGLGVDGHTASLFPGSPALKEVFRQVAAVHASAAAVPQRFTLTFPLINAAATVMFLAAGAEKAKVVKTVLGEPGSALPAAMARPSDGRLVWLLDRDAASLLNVAKSR